jgi:phosphopantetheine adenylyltransferase
MTDLSNFLNELTQIAETKNVVPEEPKFAPVKFLLVSTHTNQVNGYSKVAFNMIKRLATHSWITVVHFGTHNLTNADLGRKLPSIKSIDASALEGDKDKDKKTGFAHTELTTVIQQEKPDVVFIYNDLAMICTYIESIRKVFEQRSFRVWAYVDTTYVMQPQTMIDVLNRDVERIFCFTKSWKDSIKSQGITRPVDVLRHGVDTSVFKVIPKDIARLVYLAK